MYREYFGLEEMPFSIAPDPRYLYMSEQHREALAHLVYGINSGGGFVLLTGEVGTGKTTVCRCLLEQIPENSRVAFILNPKLTVEELLATVCDEFGVRYPEGNTSIKIFVDLINRFLLDAHARGFRTVLIIDEAQNLSADVLEQLRLLTNLETSQHKLLQIILLGQPELKDKLSQPELRQLAQRIIARFHLGPLSKKDVASYVTHRLQVAGLRTQQGGLFTDPTISKLYNLSGGIPRLINILCDRALLGAYAQGQGLVNKRIMAKAAREVFGQIGTQDQQKKIPVWLSAGLIIILTVAVITAYYNNFYDRHTGAGPAYQSQTRLVEQTGSFGAQPVVTDINATAIEPPVKRQVTVSENDVLQWPADQPISISEETANRALFKLWGINYLPHAVITACSQAEAQGLRCLNGRGSLNNMRQLNSPAVLKLFDEQGREFYAALTSLNKETASFIIGGRTSRVAVKDLAARWLGDYTILWKTPPGYKGDIMRGNQGPVVEWLASSLALIQGRQAEKNPVFDDMLVRRLKEFQITGGLVPDGIAGANTIIHINNSVVSGIPRLSDVQVSSQRGDAQ